MILRVVVLFLLFMLIMGMVKKFFNPEARKKSGRLSRPRKCTDCGRFLIGSGPCGCRDRH